MVFGIYDPPRYGSETQSWSLLKIGDICDAVEFDYIKYFCGAGTFTLIIPRNSIYADKIYIGCFLFQSAKNGVDGFIVKNIVYENDTLKITGYDLNGLLIDRVTLYPPESADKAVKTGSTEEIVKYYVDYNCVSSEDEERNFPRLGIAENLNRGAANDAASPRLECVADVIADILGAQNMGYRIKPLFNVTGDTVALLEFEVYEAVDRTQNQKENSWVTFSFGLGNITQMKREIGVTADKNTFYCELSSGAVQRYYKKSEQGEDDPDMAEVSEADPSGDEEQIDFNTKSGYDRREEYLKLNCELNEIEIYAEHEIADRYRLTDSLEITAGNPVDYGSVYNVGDIVTVYDRERKIRLDSIISAVETKRTGTEYTVKVTLGDSKPKVLDSYMKKGQATANTVRSADGVGRVSEIDKTSEIFNSYTGMKNVAGVEGKQCYARADGFATRAIAPYAYAGGIYTEASGEGAFVTGQQNKVSGQYSFAAGLFNTVSGDHSTAFGESNTISEYAMRAFVEGAYNKANSFYVHVENNGNTDMGGCFASHIEGYSNNVSGSEKSHTEGDQNTVTGSAASHTEGQKNTVKNSQCVHVGGGYNTVEQSSFAHVGGFGNTVKNSDQGTVSGSQNTVENGSVSVCAGGYGNTVSGSGFADVSGQGNTLRSSVFSTASGQGNTADGCAASHVSGMISTLINCLCGFSHGLGLKMGSDGDMKTAAAFGKYNDDSGNMLFMIGNGTDNDNRSNAFAVDSEGNIYITGNIYINGVKFN